MKDELAEPAYRPMSTVVNTADVVTKAGKPRVAAMVTLYNSGQDVLSCIGTYIWQVDKLYVVDNSERPDEALIGQISSAYTHITYINNGGNQGIAYALNRAAQAAVEEGYPYLLTMDDDSRVPENMIDRMLEFMVGYTGRIGILGTQSQPKRIRDSAESVWYTITSGNLLNLGAYATCGPFSEPLFIDWVDHEYCFRLKAAGYEVIELNYLALDHRLGQSKKKCLFGVVIREWTSHNAVRMYYKLRNSLYVLRQYRALLPWSIQWFFYRAMLTDLINVVFFEDDTLHRLRLLIQAGVDCRNGRLGKLNKH